MSAPFREGRSDKTSARAEFFLHVEGAGEGCDHTVGCNQLLLKLSAETPAAAAEETARQLEYLGLYGDEGRVAKVVVLEVVGQRAVDVDGLLAARAREDEEAERRLDDEEDRREFARFKAKFGSGG